MIRDHNQIQMSSNFNLLLGVQPNIQCCSRFNARRSSFQAWLRQIQLLPDWCPIDKRAGIFAGILCTIHLNQRRIDPSRRRKDERCSFQWRHDSPSLHQPAAGPEFALCRRRSKPLPAAPNKTRDALEVQE